MTKVLVIRTSAGLCNRIQEILSHRLYALDNNYDLIYFFWNNTSHCSHNDINNIITFIPDVNILDSYNYKEKDEISQIIYKYTIDFNQCIGSIHDHRIYTVNNDIHIRYIGGSNVNRSYIDLDPTIIQFNKTIMDKVNNYIANNLGGKYLAIHLRSQDNNLRIDHDTINKLIETYPEHKIYLATDDIKIQHKYTDKYKNIITNSNIFAGIGQNRANLPDAIFDMLICSKAHVFCGTPNNKNGCYSSYSNIIYGLRENGGYKKAFTNIGTHIISII